MLLLMYTKEIAQSELGEHKWIKDMQMFFKCFRKRLI